MKADIIFIDHNQEAIDRAEKLGMELPEPEEVKGEVYFNLEFVDAAYINKEGYIVVYLPSGSWLLEYNEDIWNKLKDYLE